MSTSSLASPPADPWGPGALPRSVTRSGLRLMRASTFLLQTRARLRRRYALPGLELPDDLSTRAAELQQTSRRLCELLGVSVEIRGLRPTGPCWLVANHLGYLDPLAIGGMTPCVAIAKRELAGWPWLGEALTRLGGLFVTRGNAHDGAVVLRRALGSIARGVSVLTFPEGTTSIGDDVLPLRRGIFGLARRTGLPVVPIAVHHRPRESAWIDDQLFLPHYLRTIARPRTRVVLGIGEPLLPDAAPSPAALADLTRARLRVLLHELAGSP